MFPKIKGNHLKGSMTNSIGETYYYKAKKCVEGESTGDMYYIVQWSCGSLSFTYGYYYNNEFCVMGCEFETLNECEKYVQKRDLMISNGDSVMF